MNDPLGGFGTKYGSKEPDPDRPPQAKPIVVYKVQYHPKLTGRLNAAALPPIAATANMELAARELPGTRGAYQYMFGERTGRWLAAYLILGLFGVAVPFMFGVNWTVWSLGAWAIAIGVLVAVGHYPSEFAQAWLYTAPQLFPKTRREHPKRHPMPPTPSVLGIVVVGGSMVGLSTFYPVVAALVFGVLGVLALLYARYGRLRLSAELLPLYATYGRGGTVAPGVWRARHPAKQRKMHLAILYVGFSLLGACISMRVPWETLLLQEYGTWTTAVSSHFFSNSPAGR